MGPFGLSGGPGSTHISFWVLGFLLGLLRWFIENSGVAGWQAAFGPQVSGLASDFGKPLEREVLGEGKAWMLSPALGKPPCQLPRLIPFVPGWHLGLTLLSSAAGND